jgi:Na+/H+-dicarboxylate symporter
MESSRCALEAIAVSEGSTTDAGVVVSEELTTQTTEVTISSTSTRGDGTVNLEEQEEEPSRESCVMRWLTTLTVVAVLLGVGVGLLCKLLNVSPASDVLKLIGFPGDLFIRALKALVVPMIFCSMVTSTAQMCSGGANLMARWAIAFYLSTTMIAATTGILLFNIFQSLFQVKDLTDATATTTTTGSPTTTTNNVPKDPVLASVVSFGKDLVPENLFQAVIGNNLLGVITFAVFFGYMLAQSKRGQSVITFFSVCFDTMVIMVRAVIHFTPIGVGSLVAAALARAADLGSIFTDLGSLVGVVLLGQLFHVFVTYAGLYFGLTRKNPYRFLAGLPQVWMTAFGTSSSAATLSTTSSACEKMGVSRGVINFALPIGCTVNMDGSALERPIVILFIAYVSQQPLDLTGQLITALTSMLLSIGGSPIPSAGLSTLVVMLSQVGIEMNPTVDIMVGLILAIEWFLDGVRTMVNCTGDSIGAAIIDHRLSATILDGKGNAVEDLEGIQEDDAIEV